MVLYDQVLTILNPNVEKQKYNYLDQQKNLKLNSIMKLFWAIKVQENNFGIDPNELQTLHKAGGKLKYQINVSTG